VAAARGASQAGLEIRGSALEAFERDFPERHIDFAVLGGAADADYWQDLCSIEAALRACTGEGKRLRQAIQESLACSGPAV
jgi:hypothetical protein